MTFKMTDLKNNIKPFLEYRTSVGYTRSATANSNAVDLRLFTDFMETDGKKIISGKDVIAFQQYLANIRNNAPASINRKIFTLLDNQQKKIAKLEFHEISNRVNPALFAKISGTKRRGKCS